MVLNLSWLCMTTADEYSPMGILNIENAVMYWSNQSDGRVISFKGNENNKGIIRKSVSTMHMT